MTQHTTAHTSRFRPEIEGLRSVAFVLVAVYHVWFNRVSGGVDVFFAVSGFLVTLTLLGHVRRFGTVKPLLYLTRLATRLLPAAALVLLAVMVCTTLVQPFSLWGDTFAQVVASAFYYENWFLALNAVDYLATDQSRSPLQHFWAMSIQGQFYLLWLLLLFGVLWLARGDAAHVRRFFTATVLLVVVCSFAWSVVQTADNQPFAYFSTFTRVWEFGIGSLLALGLVRIRVAPVVAGVASWVGLGALLTVGFLLPVGDLFPGSVALIPVLAAASILIAGENQVRWGANALLATRPFVWMGGLGYAFYLWHWPVMIFTLTLQERDVVGIKTGIGILAVSFVLAYVTQRFVERPFLQQRAAERRRHRHLFTAAAVASAMVAGFSGAAGVEIVDRKVQAGIEARQELFTSPCFGAQALAGLDDCGAEAVAALPDDPGKDSGEIFGDRCHTRPTQSSFKPCEWGDADGTLRIALVGNSHAAVWFPALRALAAEHGWRLDTYNKAACSFSATAREAERAAVSETCLEWVSVLVDHLHENGPYDYIFTSAFAGNANFIDPATGEISFDAGVGGYKRVWEPLIRSGTGIVVMRDYPMTTNEMIDCSRLNPAADCATMLEDMQTPLADDVIAQAALTTDGAELVDMTHWFCVDGRCPNVIGNVHVYRDYHHFTETYGRSLAAPLFEELLRQTSIPLVRGSE